MNCKNIEFYVIFSLIIVGDIVAYWYVLLGFSSCMDVLLAQLSLQVVSLFVMFCVAVPLSVCKKPEFQNVRRELEEAFRRALKGRKNTKCQGRSFSTLSTCAATALVHSFIAFTAVVIGSLFSIYFFF